MDSKSFSEKVPKQDLPLPGVAAPRPKSRKALLLRVLAGAGLVAFGFHFAHKYHKEYPQPQSIAHSFADPDARGSLSAREAEIRFLAVPDTESALKTSRQYATLPHLAGSDQDLETAKDFLELLQAEFSIAAPEEIPIFDAGSKESQHATLSIPTQSSPSAWIDKYYPVLNTPLGRALDILDEDGQAIWKANLEENEEEGDPAGKYARTIGAWHGLSKEGDVTGKLVFVDYGRKSDFDALEAAGANLTGTIVIARYGGVFRGLKVKAAQEAGAVGILIYSDLRDDGSVTVENGYKPYPEGPARNPTSVQRGSVQFLSSYPGDPTTPGYPAYPNASRTDGTNIPSIPSIPISWDNAKRLLAEISEDKPFELNGALSKRDIRLLNQVKTEVTPIWNTIGVIPGHIKDEVVVLGNHRDAWVNGAADPTSGTVSTAEIVKGLGALLRSGWRPLRTIVIASWDAEEYGLVGSTEWGEDFADWIQKHVVAYLNLDVSTGGSRLSLGGSPSLAHLVQGAARDIPHPTDASRTLWDARSDAGKYSGPAAEVGLDHLMRMAQDAEFAADPFSTGVHPLGSGSDYTVFLQRLGVASIDGGFGGTHTDAVYHYHSVYDSQLFQERYADPGFFRHVAIAKYLGLVTLRVADSIILPINTTQYAVELDSYLAKVQKLASALSTKPNLSGLEKSIQRLQHASAKLDHDKEKAEKALRKALRRVGRKQKHHQCARRRWAKFRKFVKGVFGVHDSAVPHEGLEKRSIDFKKVRVGKAGAGTVKRAAAGGLEGVRFGKAAAGHLKRDEAEAKYSRGLGLIEKIRIGKAGAHKRSISLDASNVWSVDETEGSPGRRLLKAVKAVKSANAKLASFERGFISEEGIKDREWYRHLGVAPGKWLGYGATTFPALTEALDEKNSTLAEKEAARLTALIENLAHHLT